MNHKRLYLSHLGLLAAAAQLAIALSGEPAFGARGPGYRAPTPLRAPSAPSTVSGPGLWHVVDIGLNPVQRPAILSGSKSLWCGAYNPCWAKNVGYPNFAFEILYIDTGTHGGNYALTMMMSLSSEQFYDYVYLVGGGGDAADPLGNDLTALNQVISTGSNGNARLLATWSGTILSTTPGATFINTTSGPVTISGANSGEPNTIKTSVTIDSHHRALYLIFTSDCLISPSDGLWPYGTGMVIDNVATTDHGTIYSDGIPAGGTDAYGGAVLVGTPAAPVLSSRAPTGVDRNPTLATPADLTLSEGAAVNLTANASDPDASDGITITASGYPSGLTFSGSNGNPASGAITGTLPAGSGLQSPYTIEWCASDGFRGQAGGATILIVTSGTNAAPTISAPSNVTSSEGVFVSITASASDPDASNTLTLTQSGMPASLTFVTSSGPSPRSARIDGRLSCDDGNGDPTVYSVVWTVTDGLGGSANTTTFLSVNNTLEVPQITAPPSVTHQVQSFIEVDMSAVSCMGIDSLAADLSALPPGNNAVFSVGGTSAGPKSRGVLTWTPAVSEAGDYDVWFTAINGFATASVRTTIHVTRVTTGVDAGAAPRVYSLEQNRPNPFNPLTSIRYRTAAEGSVLLTVYDVQGRRLATLENGVQAAGDHERRWDGRDAEGRPLPSGLYLYRIRAGNFVCSRRMMLLR